MDPTDSGNCLVYWWNISLSHNLSTRDIVLTVDNKIQQRDNYGIGNDGIIYEAEDS